MKTIVIFLSLLVFFNCTSSKFKIDYAEKINGDWVSDVFTHQSQNTRLIFSFQDSTCTYLSPWGEFTTYKINLDTLLIRKPFSKKYNTINDIKEEYLFHIDSLDTNNLFLTPITNKSNELIERYYSKNSSQIKLKKVKKKNNFNFERIAFYSSQCYGECPSMYLEIDNNSNILFKGIEYTEKNGLFIGKLSKNAMEQISININTIDFESLKNFYYAAWTDSQTCGIKVKVGNKIYKSSAYGFDEEPVELRILFHKLMEVYKTTKLVKDSTVLKKFEYNETQLEFDPPNPKPFKMKLKAKR